MALPQVMPTAVFGMFAESNSLQRTGTDVFLINSFTVAFQSGSNIVLFDARAQKYSFIPMSETGESIASFTVSPDRRWLAVAERGAKPTALVYDLTTMRRRKTLASPIIAQATDFTKMAFSADGRYLITLLGEPDWVLAYWQWDKAKILGTRPMISSDAANITQLSFNPFDATLSLVLGKQTLKTVRYTEGELAETELPDAQNHNFVTHCWLRNGQMVLGSPSGKVQVYDGDRLLQTIDCGFPVTTLHSFGEGFMAGGQCKNMVTFDVSSGSEAFELKHAYNIPVAEQAPEVEQISIASSEEAICYRSTGNQIMLVHVPQSVKEKDKDVEEVLRGIKTEQLQWNFRSILPSVHQGRIVSMDICWRKPYIATIGSDHTLRVWNYKTLVCDLVKDFHEEVFSLALHPSGMYVVVGFTDKLRLMNLLADDVRVFKEYGVRSCKECRFSNGGHLFAAVAGNTIQVFNTWNFECIATMKGHNGKVRSLSWSNNDSHLVSCGSDGAVYCWSIGSQKRENENILKGCSYSSAVCTPDHKAMYAVGNDRVLKEIRDSQVTHEIPVDTVLTQVIISYSNNMLFVGTDQGSIRAFQYPLTEQSEVIEFRAHAAAVTRLRMSYDDRYLISSGDDGTVFVFQLATEQSEKEKEMDGPKEKYPFTEEILITKSDLEEKKATVGELKSQIEELKIANEYQIRLKDMSFTDKIREMTEKFTQEVESLKITVAVLKTEKDKDEARHETELKATRNRNTSQMHERENDHNRKLMGEFERFQELQAQLAELQVLWQKRAKDKETYHQGALAEYSEEYEAKLRMKNAELQRMDDEMQQQMREFKELRRQMEEDIDTEIQSTQTRYEKRLRTTREEGLRLKGENGIMRKKFTTLYKEIDDIKTEIERMVSEQRRLQDIIKSLEKEIGVYKKDIQIRDDQIQDKERRVYELKRSNQELEKHKFVLDYKIRDLKKQIEPKEADIADMTQHIQSLNKELEDYYVRNLELERMITESKGNLDECKLVYMDEKQKHKNISKVISSFKRDLQKVMDGFQEDNATIQYNVRRLFKKYCKSDETVRQTTDLDDNARSECQRQSEYLRDTVTSLRSRAQQNTTLNKKDEYHRIEENQSVIRELVGIRKDTRLYLKNAELSKLKGIMANAQATHLEQQRAAKIADAQSRASTPGDDRPAQPLELQPFAVAGAATVVRSNPALSVKAE